MSFPEAGKKVIPNSAWDCDDRPVQGAEKKALYRMPVFVGAEAAAVIRILKAEENKNAQRQAPEVSGQICHETVAESFTPRTLTAEKDN